MAGRSMTVGEIALASSIFGSEVDYSQVRIFDSKWKFFMPNDRAHAPDGNIYFPLGTKKYTTDFSNAPLDVRSTFIHEMTHVWQHQTGHNVAAEAIFNRSYEYGSVFSGTSFENLGIEAQAQMIGEYYVLKQGIRIKDRPSIAEYEKHLPAEILEAPDLDFDLYDKTDRDTYCFAKGTLIEVGDGIFAPIEELKVGDRVTAFDSNGTLRSSCVSNVFRNVTNRFYIVTDAAEANVRETVVTGGHAFLSENGTFERLDAYSGHLRWQRTGYGTEEYRSW